MSYFYYEKKSIFYSEAGNGTPLLFLHGNTASSKMFAGIAEKYQKHFHVILIDFLGHGQSERLKEFPADLWFYESQQLIAFLRYKGYTKVNLIGSSGGALSAINAGLEAPDLISKIIADSFEGEKPVNTITDHISDERKHSKQDPQAKLFYQFMQGEDWESVVDNDTSAVIRHANEIRRFFHKDLTSFQPDILMTGSLKDEFLSSFSADYFQKVYGDMLAKIGHGEMYLFPEGGHPAMLSNPEEFYTLSINFLNR